MKGVLQILMMLAVLSWPLHGVASQRVALVIGNATYQNAPLANPTNDAQLLKDTLKGLGFQVSYLENADRRNLVRAIQTLGQQLKTGGPETVGLFYFSGHGVQSDGHNYLLPVGTVIESEADLLPEAVDAEWVLAQMEQAGNGLNIVVLDACRNNTLMRNTRSGTRGLARMVAPVGSVVAFATDAGTVAYDGRGSRNSPYASALVRHMQRPGLELKAMFDEVAREVYAVTRSEAVPQVPVQIYKLAPTFYFMPGSQPSPAETQAPIIPTAPVAVMIGDPRKDDQDYWTACCSQSNATLSDFEAYLGKASRGEIPGVYVDIANRRVKSMASLQVDSPSPKTGPSIEGNWKNLTTGWSNACGGRETMQVRRVPGGLEWGFNGKPPTVVEIVEDHGSSVVIEFAKRAGFVPLGKGRNTIEIGPDGYLREYNDILNCRYSRLN